MSKEDILTEIRTLLAGRCAEELVFDTKTSGAANDIERATELARNLVARFGMSDKFGMMALGSVQSQYLDGGYSMNCAQETFAAADREVVELLSGATTRPSSCSGPTGDAGSHRRLPAEEGDHHRPGDDGHSGGPGPGAGGVLRCEVGSGQHH